jgi:hypothetical protein
MSSEGPLLNWTEISRSNQSVNEWKRGDIIIEATDEIPEDGYLVSALERSKNGYSLLDGSMDYQMHVSEADDVRWAMESIADRVNKNKYNRYYDESYTCKGGAKRAFKIH